MCVQDLEDDEYRVRKTKMQRRSIVRTPSITRVRDGAVRLIRLYSQPQWQKNYTQMDDYIKYLS